MKKIIILLMIGFTTTAVASIDRSQQPISGPAPTIQLGKPQTFTLKNGLKVIVVTNNKLPRAYASLDIDNPPDYEGDIKGVSSLVSSLMGNGTTTIPKEEFNEEVDFMGATISLSASGGYASSLTRFFPRVLELMADALLHPIFLEEEFNKQKAILIENVRSNEKNVQRVAGRVASKITYGDKHPFGEFLTIESLTAIKLANVENYYQTFARPNNAYLIIVGDVDFNDVKQHVTTLFSQWKKTKIPTSKWPKPKKKKSNIVYFVDMPNAVQTEIFIRNTIPISMAHPDYFALKLANQILGGSSTARLFMNLREDKGYTYGSYSSVATSRYTGLFSAKARVRNDVTAASIKEMVTEINTIIAEPVTLAELSAVKEKFVGNFIMSTERPATIASFALNIDQLNLPDNFYETYIQQFQNVTIADIQQVTQKYILKDQLNIIVVGKGSDILDGLKSLDYPIVHLNTYADKKLLD
ncbi:hypothetical protein DID76_04730 [Candidatus Marinamargulisbacteria bacterium SCGC AG-414-C22]|nr:hypothetical protein DID76_04730 [Candidatus Marinamargulisbacteria bacterium SCGC AG-414-C22]